MRALLLILKLLLKIAVAPVILVLTVFIWLCVGLVYVSGLVLGIIGAVVSITAIVLSAVGMAKSHRARKSRV